MSRDLKEARELPTGHLGRNVQEEGSYIRIQEKSRLKQACTVTRIQMVLNLRINMHVSTKKAVYRLIQGNPAKRQK